MKPYYAIRRAKFIPPYVNTIMINFFFTCMVVAVNMNELIRSLYRLMGHINDIYVIL